MPWLRLGVTKLLITDRSSYPLSPNTREMRTLNFPGIKATMVRFIRGTSAVALNLRLDEIQKYITALPGRSN